MRSDRIDGVLSFLEVLDRFKSVYRVSYLADGSRREGDADHAWHMCLFAMLVHGESDLKPDLRRVLELCLVHDLVEIGAGDTDARQLGERRCLEMVGEEDGAGIRDKRLGRAVTIHRAVEDRQEGGEVPLAGHGAGEDRPAEVVHHGDGIGLAADEALVHHVQVAHVRAECPESSYIMLKGKRLKGGST